VLGFELVTEYLVALPSKQAPIQEKWSALTNFFKKFNKAMLIELRENGSAKIHPLPPEQAKKQ
jgi:hypothetical protein